MFGRGAGGVGKSFDARQKIGVNDVRQRLGGGTGKYQHYYLDQWFSNPAPTDRPGGSQSLVTWIQCEQLV